MTEKIYKMPKLAYDYKALAPYISEEQLKIHFEKHHAAYVKGANDILEKLDKARKENTELDMKSTLKSLSFNISGHLMHSLFWENLNPNADEMPQGKIAALLNEEFGNFDRFKKEFTQAAASVEGSGWAALTFCTETKRPIIMQIEKHNNNVFTTFKILLTIDVFEHAYYLDYKNDRAKFIENFWKIINWDIVNKRLAELE